MLKDYACFFLHRSEELKGHAELCRNTTRRNIIPATAQVELIDLSFATVGIVVELRKQRSNEHGFDLEAQKGRSKIHRPHSPEVKILVSAILAAG